MPELDEHDTTDGPATATLEPPAPPSAPPGTATATGPNPRRRRRWIAWLVAVLVVVALVAATAGVVALVSRNRAGSNPTASADAFDSAMAKAGVKATIATKPVELTSVKAAGSHPFEADFTAEEISALIDAFTYSTDVNGQKLSVSGATVEVPGDGSVTLSGSVSLGDSSYSGSITGPVSFENGQITSTGATSVSAEGFQLGGAQADQATTALLSYVNDYLAAAPGLTVTEARLAGTNIHVKGTAPDTITAP